MLERRIMWKKLWEEEEILGRKKIWEEEIWDEETWVL